MIQKIGSFGFNKSLKILEREKVKIPKLLGARIKAWFRKSFQLGGFTDANFQKWTPRFKRLSRTRSSRSSTEPANLIKSGALRGDVKVRQANFNRVIVGTRAISYAIDHNEGIRGQKKRQFIGDSQRLEREIERIIFKEMDKVFQ